MSAFIVPDETINEILGFFYKIVRNMIMNIGIT